MRKEALSAGFQAANAVGDAMMVAQAYILGQMIKRPELIEGLSRTEVKTIIEGVSRAKCSVGSRHALGFLAEKHNDLFDTLLLLHSYQSRANPLRKITWNFHEYFAARDKTGVWYAGSPANYSAEVVDNHLTRLISSEDPEKVVSAISGFDGGNWATGEDLKDSIGLKAHVYTDSKWGGMMNVPILMGPNFKLIDVLLSYPLEEGYDIQADEERYKAFRNHNK